jgi:hypothetical protein
MDSFGVAKLFVIRGIRVAEQDAVWECNPGDGGSFTAGKIRRQGIVIVDAAVIIERGPWIAQDGGTNPAVDAVAPFSPQHGGLLGVRKIVLIGGRVKARQGSG